MFPKRIARIAAIILTAIAGVVVVPTGARANSTFKSGITSLRIVDSPTGPWTISNRWLPSVLVANDQVFLRDPTLYRTQQFLPKMVMGSVSIEQREAAAKLFKGLLDPSVDFGAKAGPFAPGSRDTVIEFTIDGVKGRIVATALDTSASASLPKLTAEQQRNRKKLATAVSTLTSPSYWSVQAKAFYKPTKYSAWGVKLEVSPNVVLASTFDISSFRTDAPTCIVVPATDAEAMPPTADGRWLAWGGAAYSVTLRAVLPGETPCPKV
jgi:hypothetical protein